MTWFKRIVALLFALAIAGLVALSLRPRPEKPVEVQTTSVRRGSITRTVVAAGKLQPATQVKVSSNVSGDLLELSVKEGDFVTKGQLLARIDARRYSAQVQQQQAGRASAEAELALQQVELGRLSSERERVRKLVETNAASRAELERADAEVAAQEARIKSVRQRIAQAVAALNEVNHLLSMTTLYAPMDGVVTSKLKQVGERIRGSDFSEDVLLVISTLSSMEVKVEVGEHEVVHLHEGDKAEVAIDAFQDKLWPAQVVEIAKNANVRNPGTEAEVTTFPVRLALTGEVPGALPGMSAEATIATETHDGALVVPIQAVAARSERELGGPPPRAEEAGAGSLPVKKRGQRAAMQKVVFVVEDGVARLRRVETGLASDTEIEILSGLSEGESIVEGPYRALAKEVADGKKVTPAKAGAGGPPQGKRP